MHSLISEGGFWSDDRQTGSYPPRGEESSKFPRNFRFAGNPGVTRRPGEFLVSRSQGT